MSVITGFFRFWYDFIVGDAWEIAAGIILVLAIAAILLSRQILTGEVIAPLAAAGIVLVVAASIAAEARRRSRAS
jgi:hypothetical protein